MATSIPASAPTVLLVSGNAVGLAARKRLFTRLGFQITSVLGVSDALNEIAFGCFDLIVTDYAMPHMNGVQVIHAARRQAWKAPVILLSGLVDILGLTTENTSADVVIQKGAHDAADLTDAVSQLLAPAATRIASKPAALAGQMIPRLSRNSQPI